jgi:hypothetical protein
VTTLPRPHHEAQRYGAAAQKALHRIRRNAAAKREAFLLELKTMSSKDVDADAALKNIERQLSSGRRFRRIAGALKPVNNAALTKVEIVTKQSHIHPSTGKVVTFDKVKIIDTRDALEAAIIDRNKRHFAQAGGTPYTSEPFSRIGSDNRYNRYHDADGTEIHVPEESFLETKTVMELLRERHDANTHRWSDNVSFEEFISGLLHWNEATSTSPSGHHLVLYGALLTAYCNSSGEFSKQEPDDDSTPQEMAGQVLMMIHGLAAATAKHGFFLHRWIQVVNTMIYKKTRLCRIGQAPGYPFIRGGPQLDDRNYFWVTRNASPSGQPLVQSSPVRAAGRQMSGLGHYQGPPQPHLLYDTHTHGAIRK